jgi:hypothetical protein
VKEDGWVCMPAGGGGGGAAESMVEEGGDDEHVDDESEEEASAAHVDDASPRPTEQPQDSPSVANAGVETPASTAAASARASIFEKEDFWAATHDDAARP